MAFAHREVAKAARRIAHEFYDVGARDNPFYKVYPNENAFVDKFYHHFIPAARRALVQRFEDPATPLAVKLQIGEILSLESTMPKGNGGTSSPVKFDERDFSMH